MKMKWIAGLLVLIASEVTAGAATYTFTNIADTRGGVYDNFAGTVAINDNGTVGFRANYDNSYGGGSGGGLFVAKNGTIATICDTMSIQGAVSINSSDTVAFAATGGYPGTWGVYTGNGGPLSMLISDSGPFQSFDGPSINDSGMVAFRGFLDNGTGEAILRASGGDLITIVDEWPL